MVGGEKEDRGDRRSHGWGGNRGPKALGEADKDCTPPGQVPWRGFRAQVDFKLEQLTIRKTYRPKSRIPVYERMHNKETMRTTLSSCRVGMSTCVRRSAAGKLDSLVVTFDHCHFIQSVE